MLFRHCCWCGPGFRFKCVGRQQAGQLSTHASAETALQEDPTAACQPWSGYRLPGPGHRGCAGGTDSLLEPAARARRLARRHPQPPLARLLLLPRSRYAPVRLPLRRNRHLQHRLAVHDLTPVPSVQAGFTADRFDRPVSAFALLFFIVACLFFVVSVCVE